MEFALTYTDSVFDTRTLMMGRQSAGVGFLRAALNSNPHRLWCYAASRRKAQDFGRNVAELSRDRSLPELRYISWEQPERLVAARMLYRADPDIGSDAWHRRRVGARAYSLCGITHSLSTQKAMKILAGNVVAPLYPWDAIICTSTVARDVMKHVVEAEMEHLRARVGATSFTLPQFPLIPLGVHQSDFEFTEDKRAAARARIGLTNEDVAVLFAGRLSFHSKSHPLAMFLGLQAAAERSGVKVNLVVFGQFPSPQVGDAYRREFAQFAPLVKLIYLDGSDSENRSIAWAVTDIFTSLSDNIQETFGLTPVEAMAGGLPVVVSDWNGYKDTVRHGVDGFRVPTIMPGAGNGADLSLRAEWQIDNYDYHIGSVSQFTGVDVHDASEAYWRLIMDRSLRLTMGQCGRKRVAERYDWSVVFAKYVSLWGELEERRRGDVVCSDERSRRQRPDRLDPFELFQSFPSTSLVPSTLVRRNGDVTVQEALSRRALSSVAYASGALPNEDTIRRVFDAIPLEEWQRVSALIDGVSPLTLRTVAWLIKMNLVTFKH